MMAVRWKDGRAVCRVDALRLGQRVDLEADSIADPHGADGDGDHPEFAFEFETVAEIERESAECIRLDFESGFSCGFPPDHEVDVDGEQTPEELDAAEGEYLKEMTAPERDAYFASLGAED